MEDEITPAQEGAAGPSPEPRGVRFEDAVGTASVTHLTALRRERSFDMVLSSPVWRQQLLTRLEIGMGRPMLDADRACMVWNEAAGTLTVQSAPLLAELRGRNLLSNVFRSRAIRR